MKEFDLYLVIFTCCLLGNAFTVQTPLTSPTSRTTESIRPLSRWKPWYKASQWYSIVLGMKVNYLSPVCIHVTRLQVAKVIADLGINGT